MDRGLNAMLKITKRKIASDIVTYIGLRLLTLYEQEEDLIIKRRHYNLLLVIDGLTTFYNLKIKI